MSTAARKQRKKPDIPHSELSERSVAACAVGMPEFWTVADWESITSKSFVNPQFGGLYSLARYAHENGLPVAAHVGVEVNNGAVSGFTHDQLRLLVHRDMTTPFDAEYHSGLLLEKQRLRDAMFVAAQISLEATTGTLDADRIRQLTDPLLSVSLAKTAGKSLKLLQQEHPAERPAVIETLLREQEVMNLIGSSKTGKSWLAYLLAVCVCSGQKWLDHYPTAQGEVLYVDNELHQTTLVQRFSAIARALRIDQSEFEERLTIESLRGQLIDIYRLRSVLTRYKPGRFKVIVLDAAYRFYARGMSENDNAAMTEFYNVLDSYSKLTGAAIICVHHASKGNQGSKAIQDVGSGAGAQSRAADTHCVLRPHEEDGAFVMQAAVRSFAPVDAIAVRFSWPLWWRDPGLDASKLKAEKPKGQGREPAGALSHKLLEAKAVEVRKILRKGAKSKTAIRELAGFNSPTNTQVIAYLSERGEITEQPWRGNQTRWHLVKSDSRTIPDESGLSVLVSREVGQSDSLPFRGESESGFETGRESVFDEWNQA